jgi:TatD DNase family protein
MPHLVDFHCHLDLIPDPQRAFTESIATNVETLSVTTTPLAWPRNQDFAAGARNVRIGLGFHPQLVGEKVADIAAFERFAPEARYIGEIGLDAGPRYYRLFADQQRLFQRVLEICAGSGRKILSIHSVRSARQVLDHLERFFPASAGTPVLHWFTGSASEARRAVAFGCFFSINPRMAHSKSGASVLREVPPNRLLTESDAPFAESNTGTASRPGEVQGALDWIAQEKKLPPERVRQIIADNLRVLENRDVVPGSIGARSAGR